MAGQYGVALVAVERIFLEELAEQQLVAVWQLGNMGSMAGQRIEVQQHKLVVERMGSAGELVELVSLELVEHTLAVVAEQLVFVVEQPFFELALVECIS